MPPKNKTLAMVPATPGSMSVSLFTPVNKDLIPAKAKKLNLPPMVDLNSMPVGSMLNGEIIALVNSISNRADMKDSKLIHLRLAAGPEILLPMTGVIKKAIGGNEGVEKNVGKNLFVVRNPDGETTKYGKPGDAPKKVYMFDIYLE